MNRLIDRDGLSGVTSNPTIFAKAISGDSEYDDAISGMLRESPSLKASEIFERIEVEDIRMTADQLRPIYDRTNGHDGYVSIEVSPHLACDTNASITEARRLWQDVGRPNLMVKIPATVEGMGAIEELTAEGINVNVTLIFSVSQYEEVIEAYLRGSQRNPNARRVFSVASFFVSRVDTAVDKALEEIGTGRALALRGKAGIANARLAYRWFRDVFSGTRFQELSQKGVRVQKPLWASTGTKNKQYSDVLYIENLIGPDTINSVPPETLDAFRDHGKARLTLGDDHTESEEVMGQLLAMEINLRSVGQELTEQGVDKFQKSYDELLQALEKKRARPSGRRVA